MKTVIEMAEACGIPEFVNNESQAENIMRFAELVRADAIAEEREECAKVCSDLHLDGDDDNGLAADLIRARSNT